MRIRTKQIVSALGPRLVHHERIDSTFGMALGDYGYLVRSPDLEEIHAMAQYILQQA